MVLGSFPVLVFLCSCCYVDDFSLTVLGSGYGEGLFLVCFLPGSFVPGCLLSAAVRWGFSIEQNLGAGEWIALGAYWHFFLEDYGWFTGWLCHFGGEPVSMYFLFCFVQIAIV